MRLDDEILTKGIVEIYKEVLRGDRKSFPRGTWQRPDAIDNTKKYIIYLIEEKLKLSDEEVRDSLSQELFCNNKLRGMLSHCFNGSPFEAINETYPNKFKMEDFAYYKFHNKKNILKSNSFSNT